MNYLFFDIECANCDYGNGKICSFGYVKLNDLLEVTEIRDIIINPKAPFRLRSYGANAKVNIKLAYPESVFKIAKPFPDHYEEVRSLLLGPNTLIFGFAPENDAGFLRSEFERYGLPMIDFRFYDVQRIFKHCSEDSEKNLSSLPTACESLGIDPDIANHKSSSDALATAMVLKKLCQKHGLSPLQFIENVPRCGGALINGNITATYFKPKTPLKPGEKNMLKGINKDRFKNIIRKLAVKQPMNKGKKFCFSGNYEYYHFSEMCVIVTELIKKGYRYSAKVSECDFFVKKPEKVGGICKRLAEAEILNAQKNKPKIIEFNEFLKNIGISFYILSKKAASVLKNFEDNESEI